MSAAKEGIPFGADAPSPLTPKATLREGYTPPLRVLKKRCVIKFKGKSKCKIKSKSNCGVQPRLTVTSYLVISEAVKVRRRCIGGREYGTIHGRN